VTPLQEIMAEWVEWVNLGEPITPSRLVDSRSKLTANIKFNLYRGGDRDEGRDALIARNGLDDFIFKATQEDLVQGRIEMTDPGKRAIIIETYLELVDLLDHARITGGTRRGIKAEMQKLINDPDRFDRFNDDDKAAIREMARGLAIFVKIRFDRLHESLRRRAGRFMGSRSRLQPDEAVGVH
jgi:hypothetical protein